MTQYQATYTCSCEDGYCEVVMKRNEGVGGKPPVCLLGKNISYIIENGFPKWEVKNQRFKNDSERE